MVRENDEFGVGRMSMEGIWTGEIYGPYGWESRGIFVLENGRIMGGDNRQYSIGTYDVSGDTMKAEMVVHYYGPPRTVFGEEQERFNIEMTGTVDEGTIEGQVIRPDKTQFTVACRLTKRMDRSDL
jgi:hypothetical protein